MSHNAPLRLPDEVTQRARDIAEGRSTWSPPEPRDAATVVLLRDTERGPEVFLMRRVTTMAFAAGMHVFPGGSVDVDDTRVPVAMSDEHDAALDQRLSAAPGAGRALLGAAARETFEECGVLLVSPPVDTGSHRWESRRQDLVNGAVTFSSLLEGEGLLIDAAAIRPWEHWITPEAESRRYDTRFFVAALPASQQAHDVGGEADRVRWLRPADALARHAAGDLPMLLPTVAVLASMSSFASADEIVSAAEALVIRPQLPRARLAHDGALVWSVVDAETGEVLREAEASPDDVESSGAR